MPHYRHCSNCSMDIVKVISIALVATVAVVVLRQVNKELAMILTIATTVLLVFVVLDELFDVVYSLYELADSTNIDSGVLISVLKIIGIGYLVEFANNICTDAGCASIGNKVLFCGKVAIVLVALPIIENLVSLLLGMI